MAVGDTKGDILNRAFSALRISGITADPSPEDLELAITKLENMAAEFSGRNMSTGYAFEDDPDPNCPHNLDRKFWHSFDVNLAVRLMPDYGKGFKPDVSLIRQASAGISFLASATALVKQVQYPGRMPMGSRSKLGQRWGKFYRVQSEAPNSYLTKTMYIGDINDFVEHFDSYLNTGEDVSSHTIEAETGLTINSDSLVTPDVLYNITAAGTSDGTSVSMIKVKIVATTSDGRVETRIINFRLLESEIDD